MKTLVIETVKNGWIVRPYSYSDFNRGSTVVDSDLWVYTSIQDIQKDLPRMLGDKPDFNIAEYCSACVPPKAAA